MKKKLAALLVGLMVSMAGHAQFEQDKLYFSAAASNMNLNFTGSQKWGVDAQAKAGWLFEDDWMVVGNLGYGNHKGTPNYFNVGAGLRYYIEQNGLYLGLGANYVHNNSYDDFMPEVNLGYAFFLSRTVTIEPELYYKQSLKDHSDYSGFGLRLGFGIYLFTD